MLLVACALVLTPSARGKAPRAAAALPGNDGSYAIVDSGGGVMTFGGAGYAGDALGVPLQQPIVGAAANPGGGYWLVASDGGIFAYGDAAFQGSIGGRGAGDVVGLATTSSPTLQGLLGLRSRASTRAAAEGSGWTSLTGGPGRAG